MLLLLQLGLCAIGFWWMCAKSVRFGAYELARPGTFFVGVILFIQAPLVLFLGFAAGASVAVLAAKEGAEPDLKKAQKKYGWMDPGVTGGAVVLATLVGVAVIRRPEPELPEELAEYADEVVGVRDFARERREKEAEDRLRHAQDYETDEPPMRLRDRL